MKGYFYLVIFNIQTCSNGIIWREGEWGGGRLMGRGERMSMVCPYLLGRIENQKIWIFSIPQVGPIDAHKNKHIY